MNTQPSFLRRHALVIGIALMFLLTWPNLMATSGLLPFELPFIVSYLVGYGIAVAALLLTGLTEGRSGLARLLKRYLIWRVRWKWYAVAFLLAPTAEVVALWVHAQLTGMPIDFGATPAAGFFGPNANLLLLVIPFLLSDALTNGEEIGWRGYVLPRLQSRYSALTSSLILGVIWACWHLPKAAYLPSGNLAVFGVYLIQTVALTTVYTWIFNNTRGSLLLVALFHASSNTAGFFLPGSSTVAGDLTAQLVEMAIWVIVAIVVVRATGAERLSRTAPKQVHEHTASEGMSAMPSGAAAG